MRLICATNSPADNALELLKRLLLPICPLTFKEAWSQLNCGDNTCAPQRKAGKKAPPPRVGQLLATALLHSCADISFGSGHVVVIFEVAVIAVGSAANVKTFARGAPGHRVAHAARLLLFRVRAHGPRLQTESPARVCAWVHMIRGVARVRPCLRRLPVHSATARWYVRAYIRGLHIHRQRPSQSSPSTARAPCTKSQTPHTHSYGPAW